MRIYNKPSESDVTFDLRQDAKGNIVIVTVTATGTVDLEVARLEKTDSGIQIATIRGMDEDVFRVTTEDSIYVVRDSFTTL